MTFQLKIELLHIDSPKVWRRILVPGHVSFHRLHRLIQALFGWTNSHLYEFSPKGLGADLVITHPSSLPEPGFVNSTRYKLNEYFNTPKQIIIYTYDFGDNWEHQITLEKILNSSLPKPVAMGGAGATPPEDCGGPPGYQHLKEVINNPAHEDYQSLRTWLGWPEGVTWNANSIDEERIIQEISRIR